MIVVQGTKRRVPKAISPEEVAEELGVPRIDGSMSALMNKSSTRDELSRRWGSLHELDLLSWPSLYFDDKFYLESICVCFVAVALPFLPSFFS